MLYHVNHAKRFFVEMHYDQWLSFDFSMEVIYSNVFIFQGKLKCRGNGRCNVKSNINKRCKRCRLEKCLKSG